jgi:hypothetical protein
MDPLLRQRVQQDATRIGVPPTELFYSKLDSYIAIHFRGSPTRDQNVIQAYIAAAAIRIAKAEGKRAVEAEDAKAAIYLFHLPDQPDDDCSAAGRQALSRERSRARFTSGTVLTPEVRQFLDQG